MARAKSPAAGAEADEAEAAPRRRAESRARDADSPRARAQKEIDALVEEQQAVMAEEAKVAGGFKERKKAIQDKIDRRTARAALEQHLEGLPPEARKAVLADLAKGE
jgi:hypothetical protein